ncbi:MAG: hypothetical protein J6K26_09340 [Lachnospiraceae bacterium]|nr:hypothetical protein [Lachnospiraceae bacterium]
MIEDFDLVVASFQAQYGIRLSKQLNDMKWDEFKALLVGIGPDTPLGRIVSIRAEEDKEVLKYFTREQNRIRNDWRTKHRKVNAKKESQEQILEQLKQAFISMAGGI